MIASVSLEATGVACNWSTKGPMITIVSLEVICVDSKLSVVGLMGLCIGMSAPVRTSISKASSEAKGLKRTPKSNTLLTDKRRMLICS